MSDLRAHIIAKRVRTLGIFREGDTFDAAEKLEAVGRSGSMDGAGETYTALQSGATRLGEEAAFYFNLR